MSLWTQRLKDYFTDTKSKSPTITHRFHSFNFTGSYGTLNGLDAEWTVTSLWPTDFTLSWIFLKVHKEEKKLLLTRFITLFRGFLAIAKFVECFARLMLSCLTSSINKSDLLAFYLSKLHPVRANIFVSMMDSLVWSEREREKERSAWKFCKRNIHLFVSALWRLLPFLPLSSSNSSHERLWVKVSCFEASSALVPFQSSLSPGHTSIKSTESSATGLRFLTSWCAGQKRSL